MKRNNVKQITILLTADEYAHVKQLSKDSGLKMEPAIRRLIMGVNLRPRPPAELPELLRQLSGIGTNINQIAKVACLRLCPQGGYSKHHGNAGGIVEGGEARIVAYTKVFAIRARFDKRVRYITDG